MISKHAVITKTHHLFGGGDKGNAAAGKRKAWNKAMAAIKFPEAEEAL